MTRRVLSLLIALFLLLIMYPTRVSAAGADANTPMDHPNTYVNIGNQRADIIGVAKTQVGYREASGNNTKYGAWYGWNYYGWCGAFVAWCANQAGIPTSIIPKTGVPSPSAFGVAEKSYPSYIPQPGDLFFSKSYSHVGIVYYLDGEYFYSLEGNTWEGSGGEGVYIRRHALSSFVYGSPNYQGGGNHSYVLGSEATHPHKVYYRCSDCGDQYYTGATTTAGDCLSCKQASCSHSYSKWGMLDDQNHSRTCSLCGLVQIKSHSWNNGKVTKQATCSETGLMLQTCSDCAVERESVVPKTGTHSYSAWAASGDNVHMRSCSVCGKQETQQHQIAGGWSSDNVSHWYACSICSYQKTPAEHVFGEICDSPCTVCGYASESGHHFGSVMVYDDTAHWYACSGCEERDGYAVHEFSASCDDLCDACGFERVTEHSYSDTYDASGLEHWISCSVCGKQKELSSHTVGKEAYEGAATFCTVCLIQLTEEQAHEHFYSTLQTDAVNHWGSCACGEVLPTEAHSWSIKTGCCSICGAAPAATAAPAEDSPVPWVVCGCVLVVAFLIPVIVVVCRKKD